MSVKINRIDNKTYSFRFSDKYGIKAVAKSLTFPNPNPISRNRTIEFFDKKNFYCTFSKFMTLLPTKTNLYKILNYLYEVINENEITSFKMNDLDVKYYMLDNHEENVKEYHSLIIVKPGAVKQIFMHSFNSNPTLLVFVNRISPFKTLYEMSKDNKISVKSILKL